MTSYRLAIDIGGTFTDLVLLNEENQQIAINKRLTTPWDPSVAAMDGVDDLLQELNVDMAQVSQIVYATTLATNTVVERKGEKTSLIITSGFRDVLEIQRQKRYEFFDFYVDRPISLVPRYHIWEVTERVNANGEVLRKLDVEQVRRILAEITAYEIKTVAVCLLHAYRNPEHEHVIRRVIQEQRPDLMVSISSEVSPVFREYERTTTTVINAYVMPVMKAHLEKIDDGFKNKGYCGNIYGMQSSGGIASMEILKKFPARTIESGPTAGVMGAAFFGKIVSCNNLISFDMGGTTAKIGLIEGGKPETTNEFEINCVNLKKGSGLPINIPALEVIEIGAGGGSIARVKMGLISVGPDSAGASPGPICYQKGGILPTVTDANLVLGYLNPSYFLGGKMDLNKEASGYGIEEKIARPLGLTVTEAAWGIHEIINNNMASATRLLSIERGRDPRLFTLVAFGGAGPTHATRIAKNIYIPKVICPARAGVASAFGLLAADIRFDLGRTLVTRIDERIIGTLRELYQEMEAAGKAIVQQANVKGNLIITRWADMRYVGQGHEVATILPPLTFTPTDISMMRKAFYEAYANLYGCSDSAQPIEGVNWKLTVTHVTQQLLPKRNRINNVSMKGVLKGKRKVYFPEFRDYIDCNIYDRYQLMPGALILGPAVVEERESTLVIPPGDSGQVDQYDNIIIEVKPLGA